MLQALSVATVVVNLLSMMGSLWVGLYIVTRSSRSLATWLSAILVWLLAVWFLFNALRFYPNSRDPSTFGPLVQSIEFAVPVLFHLSYVLRYEVAPPRPAVHYFNLAMIVLGYGIVIWLTWKFLLYVYLQPAVPADVQRFTFAAAVRPPSYIIFFSLMVLMPLLSLVNLYHARQAMLWVRLRRQVGFLMWAVGIAYIGAVAAGVGILLRLNLPTLPSDLLLAAGVAYLGYGVARYQAMLDGRPLTRDTLYSLLGLAMVSLVYGALTLNLFMRQQATLYTVALILASAVITHTLYDAGRTLLERLLYRDRYQKLRADLRYLSMEAGEGAGLDKRLNQVLRRLLDEVGSREGFIALREENEFVVETAVGRQWTAQKFPTPTLTAPKMQELTDLDNTTKEAEMRSLKDMALLVPLCIEEEQIAALVVGSKPDGEVFQSIELDRLNMFARDLGEMIHISRQQDEFAQALDRQVDEFRERERAVQEQLQELATPPASPDEDLSPLVEEALQRLDDYSYLGEHQLAHLHVVAQGMPTTEDGENGAPITHVDRGKALRDVLIDAIDLLRPNGPEAKSTDIPTRVWQPYIILHHHYVNGEMVRDITSRLYISERTYHRRRKEGIRSVAKSLGEMENQMTH